MDEQKKQELNEKLIADLRKLAGIQVNEAGTTDKFKFVKLTTAADFKKYGKNTKWWLLDDESIAKVMNYYKNVCVAVGGHSKFVHNGKEWLDSKDAVVRDKELLKVLNDGKSTCNEAAVMEKQGHYEPLTDDEAPENDVQGVHKELKMDKEEAPKDEGKDKKEKGGKEEEPKYPEVVSAMAAKMEGKTGDELVELVAKIYEAGVKDGVAQAKAEEEGEGKEKKEKSDKEEPVELNPDAIADDELPPEEEEKKVKEEAEVKRLRKLINY